MQRVRALFLVACAVASAMGCGRGWRSAKAPVTRAHDVLLPARVRRLTNAEYERTVAALVGAPERIAVRFPPDVRQDGYTPNAEAAAPTAWASVLDTVARDVAHRAVQERFDSFAPCARARASGSTDPGARAATGDDGCADFVVENLGRRAWRRPLEPGEHAMLLGVLRDAARDAGFVAGVEALLRALLESPSLLYVTELGEGGPPGAVVTLRPYEVASLMSYTLRGAPPDEELLSEAASGALLRPDARSAQARRLLSLSDTRLQFRRFVLEWLEVDGLARTSKNDDLFPTYDEKRELMLAETTAFADEVMVYMGGSVRALLNAGFASVEPEMARFYGLKTWGARASLAGTRRAGVLQQASFLSAHAHEDTTSPVKRGDFVLRRLLCTRIPRPAEVGIETVFPLPSHVKSTRERFAAHSSNPACRTCHERLDEIGYTFESFDAIGAQRSSDNGKRIDTRATAELNGKPIALGDSLDLSRWLAQDPEVDECYLRQAYRYFTGQADPRIESELVGISSEAGGNLFDALVSFVESDLFVLREVPR